MKNNEQHSLFDIFELAGRADEYSDFDPAMSVLGETPSELIFAQYQREYDPENPLFNVRAFNAFFRTAEMFTSRIYCEEVEDVRAAASEASKCLQLAFGIAEHHNNGSIQKTNTARTEQLLTNIKNILPENDPALDWV